MNNIFSFFHHNWWKILLVNFKCLPFKQAVKLPIDVYGKLRIISLRGSISLKSEQIKTGMIKLGSQGRDMFPIDPVILDVRGSLEFNGSFYIGCGSTIRVEEGGNLLIGDKSRIGAQSIVFCQQSIKLGNQVEVSWRCQMMDTDRHEVIDINTGFKGKKDIPIQIGDNVWVGNNVLMNKGTIIPSNTIVASYTLCNKDYNSMGENNILGGIPAKVISTGKRRVWEK